MNPPSDSIFWKKKLAAFLHDSPSKSLDIARHEERADAALRRAGLVSDDQLRAYWNRASDHTAAAADRIPFPHWRSSKLSCAYDPQKNPFRHPMGAEQPLARDDLRLGVVEAEGVEQSNQPGNIETGHVEGSLEDARARFFAHWRLWRRRATERHAGFAALPADTRIPDHTIWNHMGVVSALEGCDGEPALLRFQLGPVQDFIAAARSTRDLWSGSYLLSWLMAAGLAKLALEIGPDSVIFPNLWRQPLFDLHLRTAIYCGLRIETGRPSAWEQFEYPLNPLKSAATLPLHTPNLPNVFLALVPASRGAELARLVEKAIRDEWRRIGDSVEGLARDLFDMDDPTVAHDAAHRYKETLSRHLDISWHCLPIHGDIESIIQKARTLLPADTPEGAPEFNGAIQRLESLIRYFTDIMPEKDRDARYYVGGESGPKNKLNNLGVAWSVAAALSGWLADAARATRRFAAAPAIGDSGNQIGKHGGKDALNGREPMLFGGSAAWLEKVRALPSPAGYSGVDWHKLFRHRDEVGPTTLVKRLWHIAYLKKEWGLKPHAMPNTHELATGQPDKDDESDVDSLPDGDKYYAVIALDGDSIGKWVSGAMTPVFRSQLSSYCHTPGRFSPLEYFEHLDRSEAANRSGIHLLSLQRPLSPSYHLQFSEALSNFALSCAPRIVQAYEGKLLYAGGDDVLAMVPAVNALACADDLQRAFRGLKPVNPETGIEELSRGFLSVESDGGRPIPLILPGPRASASVGMVIAHFKQPLQDVVREARQAEKRAKRIDGKHAIGITLLKRSGEIVHWDSRFDADNAPETDAANRGGLRAAQRLLYAMGCEVGFLPNSSDSKGPAALSKRFPHRLAQLLRPHLSDSLQDAPGLEPAQIFERELAHAIAQQRGREWGTDSGKMARDEAQKYLSAYLANLRGGTIADILQPMVDLLATVAFLARQPALRGEK